MAATSHILTYEEWLQMPTVEDGREEVVNGELQFMSPTRYPHAEIIRLLIDAFSAKVDKKQVRVYGSNLGLLISRDPLICRSPDLVVYWRDKMVVEKGLFCAPPDLVVEVISPSETKRRKQQKLDDYARIGVPEAWIVSPEAQSVEVHLLSDGKLGFAKIFIDGARFPGVSIPAGELWPEEFS